MCTTSGQIQLWNPEVSIFHIISFLSSIMSLILCLHYRFYIWKHDSVFYPLLDSKGNFIQTHKDIYYIHHIKNVIFQVTWLYYYYGKLWRGFKLGKDHQMWQLYSQFVGNLIICHALTTTVWRNTLLKCKTKI